jgi:hypothetical protein
MALDQARQERFHRRPLERHQTRVQRGQDVDRA